MAFSLPSVKPKPEMPGVNNAMECNDFVPQLLIHGICNSSRNDEMQHPLIQAERNYQKNRQQLDYVILRNTQGLHAPLKLQMEQKFAQKVGHLPFLTAHHAMLDSLTGRDLEIGPADVFNTSEFSEVMGQPHAMVEKNLGLI